MRRRGQYSLIWFITIIYMLFTLVGLVSNRMIDNTDQVIKAQEVLKVADLVNAVRVIQQQERQLGVDYAGIHLGSLGLFPRGVSDCGVSVNNSDLMLDKYIPYWKSDKDTAQFYNVDGYKFNLVNSSTYASYRFDEVTEGYYNLSINGVSLPITSHFLVDGVPRYNSAQGFYLKAGNHLIVISNISSGASVNGVYLTGLCNRTIPHVAGSNCPPAGSAPTAFKTTFTTAPANRLNKIGPVVLNRIIHTEVCKPDDYLIKNAFEDYIDVSFSEIDMRAVRMIYELPYILGLNLLQFNFPIVSYKAVIEDDPVTGDVVEGFNDNSILINFYPTNIDNLMNVIYKSSTSTIDYTGTQYIFDAFDSDFSQFRSAGYELIDYPHIEDFYNSLLLNHSYFELLMRFKIEGSANTNYEKYLNKTVWPDLGSDYNAYGFDIATYGDFHNYFGYDYHGNSSCTYLMREFCQFFSDDKYHMSDTVKGYHTRRDENALPSTELFDSITYPLWNVTGLPGTDIKCIDGECTHAQLPYTQSLNPSSDWGKLVYHCTRCHNLPYPQNPCLNVTNLDCQACFNIALGVSGAFTNSGDGKVLFLGTEQDCHARVYSTIIPMLNGMLKVNTNVITEMLNARFDDKYPIIDWWINPNKVNITGLVFYEIDSNSPYFNSSCNNCQDAVIKDLIHCRNYTNDLSVDFTLGGHLIKAVEGGLDTYYFNTPLENDPTSYKIKINSLKINSSNLAHNVNNDDYYIDIFFENNDEITFTYDYYTRSTKSNIEKCKVGATKYLFDLSSNLTHYEGIYTNVQTAGQIKSGFIAFSNYPLKNAFELFTFAKECSITYNNFISSLNHKLHICVRTPLDDEWDYTDNCKTVRIKFCPDGDMSEACCVNRYGKQWFSIPGIDVISGYEAGACCGDDAPTRLDDTTEYQDDDFQIDDNRFCWNGVVHNCPSSGGALKGGYIRLPQKAQVYTHPKSNFYCKGVVPT